MYVGIRTSGVTNLIRNFNPLCILSWQASCGRGINFANRPLSVRTGLIKVDSKIKRVGKIRITYETDYMIIEFLRIMINFFYNFNAKVTFFYQSINILCPFFSEYLSATCPAYHRLFSPSSSHSTNQSKSNI